MVPKNDRPTLRPAFDVAKHARDSDAHVRGVGAGAPQRSGLPRSETRLSTRPPTGGLLTDEAWARMMTGAPVVVMGPADLVKLPLDHRAGFLMSRMDGFMDLDTLIEVSTLKRALALRIVRDLHEAGAIQFV
jgi:hypothetical protein